MFTYPRCYNRTWFPPSFFMVIFYVMVNTLMKPMCYIKYHFQSFWKHDKRVFIGLTSKDKIHIDEIQVEIYIYHIENENKWPIQTIINSTCILLVKKFRQKPCITHRQTQEEMFLYKIQNAWPSMSLMLEALTSFHWLFLRNKIVYFKYLIKYFLSDVFSIVVWTTLQISLNNIQGTLIRQYFNSIEEKSRRF